MTRNIEDVKEDLDKLAALLLRARNYVEIFDAPLVLSEIDASLKAHKSKTRSINRVKGSCAAHPAYNGKRLFAVSLTRHVSESLTLYVRSAKMEGARKLALGLVDKGPSRGFEWEAGEWLGDPEVVEIMEEDEG